MLRKLVGAFSDSFIITFGILAGAYAFYVWWTVRLHQWRISEYD